MLPFARELEIMDSNTINELLDGEKIEDYSDVNKIYKEIENNNIEDEKR